MAQQCCSSVELIEKTSMQELEPIGLINDPKIKKSYVDKLVKPPIKNTAMQRNPQLF